MAWLANTLGQHGIALETIDISGVRGKGVVTLLALPFKLGGGGAQTQQARLGVAAGNDAVLFHPVEEGTSSAGPGGEGVVRAIGEALLDRPAVGRSDGTMFEVERDGDLGGFGHLRGRPLCRSPHRGRAQHAGTQR